MTEGTAALPDPIAVWDERAAADYDSPVIGMFSAESRHADFAGTPFTAESGSHVSLYRLTA